MSYKDRVIEFEMDDISEDFFFEGCDETYLTEEFMTNLMNKIRGCDWFIEGNKTEGVVTFESPNEFMIDWVVKTMGEDWDSDEEEEHSQKVLINYDSDSTKVVNW